MMSNSQIANTARTSLTISGKDKLADGDNKVTTNNEDFDVDLHAVESSSPIQKCMR